MSRVVTDRQGRRGDVRARGAIMERRAIETEGERSEPKNYGGSGGTPPGKFLWPRPLDWLRMLSKFFNEY